MKQRFRVRKKGKWSDGSYRYVLEEFVDKKLVKSITLPKAEVLWNILCPHKIDNNVSSSNTQTKSKGSDNINYTNFKRKNKYDGFWKFVVCPTIKKIRGNKCEECDSIEYLQVHHMDSNMENINTLKLLCRKCHIELHRGEIKQKQGESK